MIKNIWNWVKNLFVSKEQDPHLVLYEEVKQEEVKPKHCSKHIYFRKNCKACLEIIR